MKQATIAHWTALDAYLADLATRMRLGHWAIVLKREPCGDDSWASVGTNVTNYEADMYLCLEFLSRTPEQQRQTLIHELIHVHNRNITTSLNVAKPALGSGAMFEMLEKALDQAEESAADALSRVIAPFMPLPDIPPVDAVTPESRTEAT